MKEIETKSKIEEAVRYIGKSLRDVGISPDVKDRNGEDANLVDAVARLSGAVHDHGQTQLKIAEAITAHGKQIERFANMVAYQNDDDSQEAAY